MYWVFLVLIPSVSAPSVSSSLWPVPTPVPPPVSVSAPAAVSLSLLVYLILQVWLPLPLPVVSASSFVAVSAVQFSSQLSADRLEMHKVAESWPRALARLVLAAAGLSKVCHRGQLGVDWPTSEPAIVEVGTSFQSILKQKYNMLKPDQVVHTKKLTSSFLNFTYTLPTRWSPRLSQTFISST